jgi:hypothetical protein
MSHCDTWIRSGIVNCASVWGALGAEAVGLENAPKLFSYASGKSPRVGSYCNVLEGFREEATMKTPEMKIEASEHLKNIDAQPEINTVADQGRS